MQLGMIGLGRIGAGMSRRLMTRGHACVACDVDPQRVALISAALYERFSSRGEDDFALKLLCAMRSEFGGHVERAPPGGGS